MSSLCTFTKITKIEPIKKADKIETAYVLDNWPVVVQKGLHKEGDNVVFIFTDTVIPASFIKEGAEGKTRLRAVCMRGQYSAGLVLPMSEVPEAGEAGWTDDALAVALGIEKYVKPIPACISGEVEGSFPEGLLPISDETRLESRPQVLEELTEDTELVATFKLDGTSTTYISTASDGFKACSRNYMLRKSDKNTLWQIAEQLNLESKLKALGFDIAIQGEMTGPAIQKNPCKLTDRTFFVYRIKNLTENRFLGYDERIELCKALGLQHAPLVARFTLREIPAATWQKMANALEYPLRMLDGKTILSTEEGEPIPSPLAEGMVVSTTQPLFSSALHKRDWSVKVMSLPYEQSTPDPVEDEAAPEKTA